MRSIFGYWQDTCNLSLPLFFYRFASTKKELVIIAVSIWKEKNGKKRPGFAHAFVAGNGLIKKIGGRFCLTWTLLIT